jgi:hypothetical protein
MENQYSGPPQHIVELSHNIKTKKQFNHKAKPQNVKTLDA